MQVAQNFIVADLPEMTTMSVCYWIQVLIATEQYRTDMGSGFQWPIEMVPMQHKDLVQLNYNFRFYIDYYPTALRPSDREASSHELKGRFRVSRYSSSLGLTNR